MIAKKLDIQYVLNFDLKNAVFCKFFNEMIKFQIIVAIWNTS
jgi:hypothetical protein